MERYKETAKLKRQAMKKSKRILKIVEILKEEVMKNSSDKVEESKEVSVDAKNGIDLPSTNISPDNVEMPQFPDDNETDLEQMMRDKTMDDKLTLPMMPLPSSLIRMSEIEPVNKKIIVEQPEEDEDEGQTGVVVAMQPFSDFLDGKAALFYKAPPPDGVVSGGGGGGGMVGPAAPSIMTTANRFDLHKMPSRPPPPLLPIVNKETGPVGTLQRSQQPSVIEIFPVTRTSSVIAPGEIMELTVTYIN